MAGPAPRPRGLAATGALSRFAIVAARFNEPIVTRLVEGARHAFDEAKVPAESVELHWVPGSFELPLAALHLAATGRYAAIVCVGVVIRGETPHFEHVAREAAAGIRHVALVTGVPATFGIITTYTEEQAWARAGGSVGNRGEEAAAAALEMAAFVEKYPPIEPSPHRPTGRNSRASRAGSAFEGSRATRRGHRRGST